MKARMPSRVVLRLLSAGTALVVVVAPGTLAQQGTIKGAFVTTLGKDTTAVEQYTRTGHTVTGDLVVRQGGTVVNHYTLTLNADGTPSKLVVVPRKPDGSKLANGYDSAQAVYTGDSVVNTIIRDTATTTRRIAADHAFPAVSAGLTPSMAMYEVMFARLRATKADSVSFVALGVTSQRVGNPSWVKFHGKDSARIWISFPPPTPAGPYTQFVHVDATGRLLGFSGRETTQKIEVQRLSSLDLRKLAAAFAAADAAGKGLGISSASIADSVRATIGAAHVAVTYARPTARGRDVFKNGVLGDTLWRTGANAATMFTTDADLLIDGKTIPAGSYTLWTHAPPDNKSYELIFNKQTKQWGTEYHPEQDLVRVPLSVSKLSPSVEAFQIVVRPQGSGGVIALDWATTELSARFSVKPR